MPDLVQDSITVSEPGQKIAVIGGGIAGLTALHYLSTRHEVRLFESGDELGGHTHTVAIEEDGRSLPIDMGFIVFNDWTYPNFIRLLDELGVGSEASSMSLSVRCERTGLEYNGSSLNQLFAQRRNLLRGSFYRMLAGILRFHRRAPQALARGDTSTLGSFLEREGFSGPVVEDYLIPMMAAIWSTEPQTLYRFPVRTLLGFLAHHGMLSIDNRPSWRVVRGGSRRYVEALALRHRDRVTVRSPVAQLRRDVSGVDVRLHGGAAARFDQVVLATHSNQALRLLADPSSTERSVLGALPFRDNEVVLHTDTSFLPRRRLARASWNYHLNPPRPNGVQVTYSMNRLQNLDARRDYCVTLNRTSEIDPGQILERRSFAHPLFTDEGVRAQNRWPAINGVRRTWYCGAYWGWGFHEDGVRSGLRVARSLGVPIDDLPNAPRGLGREVEEVSPWGRRMQS